MTEEEILRKKLDRLNENSHYGIMIDTEITKIVRSHIKRLEDNEMKKATSVQKIENVKEMNLAIEKLGIGDEITKVIVGASTNDDIFEFHLSGEGCVVFANRWFDMVAEKAYKQDFESERNKRKMMETENSILRKHIEDDKKKYEEIIKKLEHDDMLDKNAADYWSKEHDTLSERFAKLQEENKKLKDKVEQEYKTECKNCLACPSLVDDYLKLAKKNEQLTFEKAMIKKGNDKLKKELALEGDTKREKNEEINRLKEAIQKYHEENKKLKEELSLEGDTKREKNEEINRLKEAIQKYHEENKKLKKELALEKAANEAQHKFVQNYAGKGTEVQFNYAIDDVKEVSYVISDIQATKEVVEQKLITRAGILDQAKKCVCGQREQDYGTPESNFQLIADLWNGYLFPSFLPIDKPVISATDVSMMMALMKIARIKNGGGSGDSFVDLAGYAACGGEIWHGQKAKDQN